MGQSDTGPQVAPPIPPLGTPKKSRENSTRPLKNGFVINAAYSQKKKIKANFSTDMQSLKHQLATTYPTPTCWQDHTQT